MTELMLRPTEREVEVWPARGIAFRDKVRLHFVYRFLGETAWRDANYSIDGDVVSGPAEDQSEGFQPYILPVIALPEGAEYPSQQPFKMNEAPFTQELPGGGSIEMRYVVVQRDDPELA